VSTYNPSTNAAPRPKTVLFCPDCGHESGVDGDWIVDEKPARTVLICPTCASTITTHRLQAPLAH